MEAISFPICEQFPFDLELNITMTVFICISNPDLHYRLLHQATGSEDLCIMAPLFPWLTV